MILRTVNFCVIYTEICDPCWVHSESVLRPVQLERKLHVVLYFLIDELQERLWVLQARFSSLISVTWEVALRTLVGSCSDCFELGDWEGGRGDALPPNGVGASLGRGEDGTEQMAYGGAVRLDWSNALPWAESGFKPPWCRPSLSHCACASYELISGFTKFMADRVTDWLIDRLIDWLGACARAWISGWVSERARNWASERATGWVSDWVSECARESERVSACVSEWVSEWVSERASEWELLRIVHCSDRSIRTECVARPEVHWSDHEGCDATAAIFGASLHLLLQHVLRQKGNSTASLFPSNRKLW